MPLVSILRLSLPLTILYIVTQIYEDTFIAKGKPVFNVEYRRNMDQCDLANRLQIDSIVKVRSI